MNLQESVKFIKEKLGGAIFKTPAFGARCTNLTQFLAAIAALYVTMSVCLSISRSVDNEFHGSVMMFIMYLCCYYCCSLDY